MIDDIFQEGQIALQQITKETEIAHGRLRSVQPNVHQKFVGFIEGQIFAIPSSEDQEGNLWISLLVGKRGFIKVPSLQEITIDLSQMLSNRSDIFFDNIASKSTVGVLFHEAIRRSRYRAWGQANLVDDLLSIKIKMGYPSCPKHIQKEVIELASDIEALSPTRETGSDLGQSEKNWITSAHTFFIGTQSKKGDMEASHRGGDPGFVEFLDNDILRVPDYYGNSIYSTLGNIYVNPKVALLFVDFEKGETLQITGTAELQFDQNSEEDFYKSGETGRFWTFKTKSWIRTKNHHKVNAEFVEFSRYNVLTKK